MGVRDVYKSAYLDQLGISQPLIFQNLFYCFIYLYLYLATVYSVIVTKFLKILDAYSLLWQYVIELGPIEGMALHGFGLRWQGLCYELRLL